MKKGRILIFAAAVLAALSVGGTLAAWSQVIQTGNEYRIPQYKTSLEEEFSQPDDWQPGITTRKAVWVSNSLSDETGQSGVPVLAKAELHQSWVRREPVYATASNVRYEVEPLAGEELPLVFEAEDGTVQYAALPHFNRKTVMVLSSGMAKEEGLRLGLDYVDSAADPMVQGKWLLVNEDPAERGNYVLYYIGVLQPGEDSPHFLESVTMNPLLEASVIRKDTWYERQEDGSYKQVTETTPNSRYGYDSSRYTMDIKATTVQATKAAVEQTFTGGFHEEVIHYLANEVADPGVYDASDLVKKLTVVRSDRNSGELAYIPYRTEAGSEEGNWFMSFTDMVPGGVYKDSLIVENNAGSNVRIWMRVLSREQDAIKDELLEKISMKVTFQGNVIYEGKATGSGYGEGTNLQELIPLCYLSPGASERIYVELVLEPSITCDPVTGKCIYADELSKIDWQFMIQGGGSSNGGGGGSSGGGGGNSGGGSPGGPGGGVTTSVTVGAGPEPGSQITPLLPQTGDETPLWLLGGMMTASLVLLAATVLLWKKNRDESKKNVD